MQQSIVVGFDGSERGRDALVLAREIAALLAARIVVVIAYNTRELWLWAPGTSDPLDQSERESISADVREVLAGVEPVEVRIVVSSSAAGALHAEAERERAPVIVVGSPHRGVIGRVLLGTVTQEVLDAAPCAVAVAPVGFAVSGAVHFSAVGVGFDDTPEAHNALAVARLLARRSGAELRLVWAAHLVRRAMPASAVSYANPDYFEDVRAVVEDRLEAAVAPIRGELSVRADIVRGETSDALARQSEQFDLLVLGSRGFGPLKRVLLGSVSRRLLNDARCPVLVVPRGVASLEFEQRPVEHAVGQPGETERAAARVT